MGFDITKELDYSLVKHTEHTCLKGKFVETVLHEMVGYIEENLEGELNIGGLSSHRGSL